MWAAGRLGGGQQLLQRLVLERSLANSTLYILSRGSSATVTKPEDIHAGDLETALRMFQDPVHTRLARATRDVTKVVASLRTPASQVLKTVMATNFIGPENRKGGLGWVRMPVALWARLHPLLEEAHNVFTTKWIAETLPSNVYSTCLEEFHFWEMLVDAHTVRRDLLRVPTGLLDNVKRSKRPLAGGPLAICPLRPPHPNPLCRSKPR